MSEDNVFVWFEISLGDTSRLPISKLFAIRYFIVIKQAYHV